MERAVTNRQIHLSSLHADGSVGQEKKQTRNSCNARQQGGIQLIWVQFCGSATHSFPDPTQVIEAVSASVCHACQLRYFDILSLFFPS